MLKCAITHVNVKPQDRVVLLSVYLNLLGKYEKASGDKKATKATKAKK